jgi:hypothetical protein
METKHTPGPWEAWDGSLDGFDGEWDVAGPDQCSIASMSSTTKDAKYPRNKEANAKLIAAAPDLLYACERAVYMVDACPFEGSLTVAEQMRAAIAKATT